MGRVVQLAAGEMHSLALTDTGEVWSWGDNMMQQCARALDELLLPTPGRIALPLHEGEVVVQISAAGYHGVALTSEGRLFNLGTSGVSSQALDELVRQGDGDGYADEPYYEDDEVPGGAGEYEEEYEESEDVEAEPDMHF